LEPARNSNPGAFDRDDGLRQLFFAVIGKDLCHQLDALGRRHVWQPDQARVRLCADVDERPEISIDRDQNAPGIRGAAEQRRIAGIVLEGSHLENVVPPLAQEVRQPATGTAVDQKPQADATRTASMLSSAIAACA